MWEDNVMLGNMINLGSLWIDLRLGELVMLQLLVARIDGNC